MVVMQCAFHAFAEFTEWDCAHLYNKAITENSTITLHVAKAVTIGPPEVGKTAFRHLLLQLPLIDSKPGIMQARKKSVKAEMIHLGSVKSRKLQWLVVNEASGMQSLLRFLQQQDEQVATCRKAAKEPTDTVITDVDPSPQHQSGETVEVTDPVTVDIVHGCQEEKPSIHLSDVASTASRIYQLLQSSDIANVNLSDRKLLQFLDCDGQLAYFDILPMFITMPAVYLYVFNLTKDLNHHPVDKMCFSHNGDVVFTSAKSPLTVAQMMSRSVMTVNSLIDRNMQLPMEVLQSDPPEPRVVLVGTYLDCLANGTFKDIGQMLHSVNIALKDALDLPSLCLKEMLVRNQHAALPSLFFPTCNVSLEQDKEDGISQITRHSIFELKQKIEKCAVKVRVPIKWYLHQMLEVSHSKEEHKPVHRYSDLYQSCLRERTVGDLGEFHAMITYFHALGLLIHLCEKDVPHSEESTCLVFTDPSYLFENISKLFQAQFLDIDRCEGSLQLLTCQGRLTKKALQALNIDSAYLSQDDFMDLLVQLFIGADITEGVSGDRKYGRVLFVPSVMPVSDAESQHTVITKTSCPYFIITFNYKFFIPCGVFTGAIARLLSIPHWYMLYESISRLHIKFTIGGQGTVDIIDDSTHMKVAVDVLGQYNTEQCRDIIIDAVARSYCFLFHGKSRKSLHCEICQHEPFLILGLLCHCAFCERSGSSRLSKLYAFDSIPQTVQCLQTGDTEELNRKQSLLFWNIKHYVSMHKHIIRAGIRT